MNVGKSWLVARGLLGFAAAALSIVAAALIIAAPAAAFASHYDLIDIDFVTAEERQALAKAGITATDHVIDKAGKKAARAALAKSTGVSEQRWQELAQTCDLLRVNGLGPRMVKLFALAEIRTIAALRKQSGAALQPRLQALNDEKHVAGLVPPPELIDAWVRQAQNMPILLEE